MCSCLRVLWSDYRCRPSLRRAAALGESLESVSGSSLESSVAIRSHMLRGGGLVPKLALPPLSTFAMHDGQVQNVQVGSGKARTV